MNKIKTIAAIAVIATLCGLSYYVGMFYSGYYEAACIYADIVHRHIDETMDSHDCGIYELYNSTLNDSYLQDSLGIEIPAEEIKHLGWAF